MISTPEGPRVEHTMFDPTRVPDILKLEEAWGYERVMQLAGASGEPPEDIVIVDTEWCARRMLALYITLFAKNEPGDHVGFERSVKRVYDSCVAGPAHNLSHYGQHTVDNIRSTSHAADELERCKEIACTLVSQFAATDGSRQPATEVPSADKKDETEIREPSWLEKAYSFYSTIKRNVGDTPDAQKLAADRIQAYLYNRYLDEQMTSIITQAVQSAAKLELIELLSLRQYPPGVILIGGPGSGKTSCRELPEKFSDSETVALVNEDSGLPDAGQAATFAGAAVVARVVRDDFRPVALSDLEVEIAHENLEGSQYADMTDLETKWMRKKTETLLERTYLHGLLPPFRLEFVPPSDEAFTLRPLEYVKDTTVVLMDTSIDEAVRRVEERAKHPGPDGTPFRDANLRRFIPLGDILQAYKHAGNFAKGLVTSLPEGNACSFWILSSDVPLGEQPRTISVNDVAEGTMSIFDLEGLLALSRKKHIDVPITPEDTEAARQTVLSGSLDIYAPGFRELSDNTDDIVHLAGALRRIDFYDEQNVKYASITHTEPDPKTNRPKPTLSYNADHPLTHEGTLFQAVLSALGKKYSSLEVQV